MLAAEREALAMLARIGKYFLQLPMFAQGRIRRITGVAYIKLGSTETGRRMGAILSSKPRTPNA